MKRTKTWLFVLSVVIIAVVLYIVSRNVDDERRLYRLADKQGLILDRRILKKVVKYDIVRCDIPSGVEEIGGKDMFGHFPAFSGCRKLQQVFIPETVKVIAEKSFYNCVKLETVKFSEGLKEIHLSAFAGCRNLHNAVIPASVENISEGAFKEVSALGLAEGSKYFRMDEAGALINTVDGTLIFFPTSFSGEYILPDDVRRIGKYAFYNCDGLTGVEIHDRVGVIGEFAFAGCSGLSEVVIPGQSMVDGSAFTQTSCVVTRR